MSTLASSLSLAHIDQKVDPIYSSELPDVIFEICDESGASTSSEQGGKRESTEQPSQQLCPNPEHVRYLTCQLHQARSTITSLKADLETSEEARGNLEQLLRVEEKRREAMEMELFLVQGDLNLERNLRLTADEHVAVLTEMLGSRSEEEYKCCMPDDEAPPPTPLPLAEEGAAVAPPTPLPLAEEGSAVAPPTLLPIAEEGAAVAPPTNAAGVSDEEEASEGIPRRKRKMTMTEENSPPRRSPRLVDTFVWYGAN